MGRTSVRRSRSACTDATRMTTAAPIADGSIRGSSRVVRAREFFDRAARAATGLIHTGLATGGAVAVLLRNDVVFLECMQAASVAGAYFVPINWHYKVDEVRYILTDCGATHLVVHADLLPAVRAAIPPHIVVLVAETPRELREAYGVDDAAATIPAGAVAWDRWLVQWPPQANALGTSPGAMTYTSGTTGRPKAVRRMAISPDHRDAYARLRAEWFGHRPGLKTAVVGPLYHSVQATYAYSAFRTGGEVIMVPRFDAESLLRLIEAERLTHLHLVPTMMHRLLQLPKAVRDRYDLSSLEFVIHGAAPCPPSVKRAMIEWWGPIIYEYYGTSEAGMVSRASSREWLQRERTVGRPWPGRTVSIHAADGRALPPHTEGLIYMSLGSMPDFTYLGADALRASIECDGRITNGDVGYVDDDGYLFLCDRQHDVVISGGVNIWPAEIEAVLMTHPVVLDCAVFGIPDDEYGEVPAAAIQPRHPVSADELRTYVRERIAPYKVPRHVEFHDALPRDDSGKIFKRLLRQPYWAAAGRRI